MRYKLTLAYDGTNYSGWQVQKNALSIQVLIQQALQTVLRCPIDLTGSSRTDAGVHACGQTAHFDVNIAFDPSALTNFKCEVGPTRKLPRLSCRRGGLYCLDTTPLSDNLNPGALARSNLTFEACRSTSKLRISLNALLPADIRIFDIQVVSPDFHARYSALSKTYHYHLHLHPISDPFTKLYRYQVFAPCDIEKLQLGAQCFLGTKDFTSFANVKEQPHTDAIRTLKRLDIVEQQGGLRLEFEGNGFLYKMVRNITGTLLDVATNKISIADIPQIFAACDRRKAGATAPSHGLCLMQVTYP